MDAGVGVDVGVAAAVTEAKPVAPGSFRIVSPEQGDRLGVPPGVDSAYASIGLQGAGGQGDGRASWYVDGKRIRGERWILVPGQHRILAVTGQGERDSVTVVVE